MGISPLTLDHHLLLVLLLLTILSLFVLPTSSISKRALLNLNHHEEGFRVELRRVDSKGNFTKLELIQRGMNRGKHRLERLSAMAITTENDEISSQVHTGTGEYLLSLSIGTPPVPYYAIMDTGSDLIWTQCKPCSNCYKQPTPIFDPTKSSSFSKLSCTNSLCKALSNSMCNNGGCEYLYSYGDYSSTQGVMASETFTFGNPSSSSSFSSSTQNVGFGCGYENEGSGFTQGAGLVGLGRGPLSLVSQLGTGKFSYCLTSIDDNTKSSSLLFGSLANLTSISNGGDQLQTTALIQNPSQPSFYYIQLEGITVGKTLVPIPKTTFQLKADGSGGMIIDSGTTITYLEKRGFRLLMKAFISQMNLPVADDDSTGLDLCFKLPADATELIVPKLIFHFKDADVDLPANNYMIGDSDSGLICLAMAGSSGMSIFGNVQQQNMLILHDLEKETLSFLPTKCDQL